MFALGIRYLNGWAMATHPNDREKAEWPPHPDRVFMALAAAHFETDGGQEERATLEWLEMLAPPELSASEAEAREVVSAYVPTNDIEIARPAHDSPERLESRLVRIAAIETMKSAKNSGLAIVPEFRSRQKVTFPVVIPHDSDVYLVWPAVTLPQEHERALATLCRKATFVGDPSSLVQMWVEPSPPKTTLVPDDHSIRATLSLRVSGRGGESGRLGRLVAHHELEQAQGRRLRIPCDSVRYRPAAKVEPKASLPRSVFDDALLILRRIEGPRLGLESTLQLMQALRDTVMSTCPVQPPPAWISGHAADGSPSQEPHLAFLPLPDVGHPHAEGHLLGAAIAIPRKVAAEEQRALSPVLFHTSEDELPDDGRYAGMPRAIQLTMGRVGVWRVELADDDLRRALKPETWTGRADGEDDGSAAWATATPIVFDRHPREDWSAADPPRVRAEKQAAYWRQVESMIAEACERIGLPRPAEVTAIPASVFAGAPSAGQMPRMLRKDGSEKRQTHALIRFGGPVVGPVLLGAGRYRGYGLCRPLPDGGST